MLSTIAPARALSSTPPLGSRTCRLPCREPGAPDFFDPKLVAAWDAAAACRDCPLAEECRALALQLHQAHAAGADPYGVYGCWGGWWFQPGQQPRAILPGTAAAA